jgi:uncharacterized protein YkwD
MRLKFTVILVVFAGLFQLHAFAKHPPVDTRDLEREIFGLINDSRADAGLSRLKWDDEIADVAREHSRNMARKKVPFSHNGFDERIDRIRARIPGVTGAAENIAYGPLDGPRAVKMWLNSKGHRKNIMGKYARTAVGIAEAKDGSIYLTQIFIL